MMMMMMIIAGNCKFCVSYFIFFCFIWMKSCENGFRCISLYLCINFPFHKKKNKNQYAGALLRAVEISRRNNENKFFFCELFWYVFKYRKDGRLFFLSFFVFCFVNLMEISIWISSYLSFGEIAIKKITQLILKSIF